LENKEESNIRKELKEIKALLHKQSAQNKRLMMLSIVNVYFLATVLVFVALFMERV
jgi:hypothetical protein